MLRLIYFNKIRKRIVCAYGVIKNTRKGYKPCASLMKLADKYSTERVEMACAKALSYTTSPSLKNITTILKNGQDKVPVVKIKISDKVYAYGITRGASYFKRGDRR